MGITNANRLHKPLHGLVTRSVVYSEEPWENRRDDGWMDDTYLPKEEWHIHYTQFSQASDVIDKEQKGPFCVDAISWPRGTFAKQWL